ELDGVERRFIFGSGCSRAREVAAAVEIPEHEEIFWRLRHQHPICAYQARTLDFSARKLSDFITRRRLHSLEFYAEIQRPLGVEYELEVGLPAPYWHMKCFLFDSGGRDFGERDRLLLDRLRPPLSALHAAARERRLAAALLLEQNGSRLVVLHSPDQVDFATPAAARILDR